MPETDNVLLIRKNTLSLHRYYRINGSRTVLRTSMHDARITVIPLLFCCSTRMSAPPPSLASEVAQFGQSAGVTKREILRPPPARVHDTAPHTGRVREWEVGVMHLHLLKTSTSPESQK